MSKKLKNKGVIPPAMNGKRFYSLPDLGSALGVVISDPPTPRSMKCRKCGSIMRNIAGTNVWVCDAMVEQEKDGVKKLVACGNRAMTGVSPRPQSSDPGNYKPKQQSNPANAQAAIS